MRPIVRVAIRLVTGAASLLLVGSSAGGAQDPGRGTLPSPRDTDSRLTQVMQTLERTWVEAIIHKDSGSLERLLAPVFTLRIADIPQSSLPRGIWMDNTLHRLKAESVELQHVAARRLADSVAAVSLIFQQKGAMEDRGFSGEYYIVDFWKQAGNSWRVVARYSSPVGTPPDRGTRTPPPPADIDRPLTDTLERLERHLGDLVLHGFKNAQAMDRLVGSEFTVRFSDAPEASVPRAQWGRPSSKYKIESIDQRYHAARRLADDVAVVSLLLTQKASRDGRDRSGDFYIVDIWKRRGTQWSLIARYSSPQGKVFERTPPG